MRIAGLCKILLMLLCLSLYGYWAFDADIATVHSVSIDMSMPVSLVWPFEVAVVGEKGEKGLWIGANIGRGWRGEAGGEAGYRFYIPAGGKYRLWAYCLWFDECANAIFARIDGLDKAIIGNDPIYKQWHWARGFDVTLDKGTHSLTMSNHSDHVAVQQVLLTTADDMTGDKWGVVFSDVFYDGFDGCDHGNFDRWESVRGDWKVKNPAQEACYIENALVGRSEDSALIVCGNDAWSGYSLNVAVSCELSKDTNGLVGICFGVRDSQQYHQLRWRHVGLTNTAKMELVRKQGEQTEVLAEFNVPWEIGNWHQVEIACNRASLDVRVDDSEPVQTPVKYPITGGIGFSLQGRVTAYFDDIHVRQAADRLM